MSLRADQFLDPSNAMCKDLRIALLASAQEVSMSNDSLDEKDEPDEERKTESAKNTLIYALLVSESDWQTKPIATTMALFIRQERRDEKQRSQS